MYQNCRNACLDEYSKNELAKLGEMRTLGAAASAAARTEDLRATRCIEGLLWNEWWRMRKAKALGDSRMSSGLLLLFALRLNTSASPGAQALPSLMTPKALYYSPASTPCLLPNGFLAGLLVSLEAYVFLSHYYPHISLMHLYRRAAASD